MVAVPLLDHGSQAAWRFSNWSNGFAGTGTVNGDSPNSSLPPTTVTATVRAILQGVGVDTKASGIID
ncbi:MAG: hypothetical protein QM765_21865 [Myxococcales bacterium]